MAAGENIKASHCSCAGLVAWCFPCCCLFGLTLLLFGYFFIIKMLPGFLQSDSNAAVAVKDWCPGPDPEDPLPALQCWDVCTAGLRAVLSSGFTKQ